MHYRKTLNERGTFCCFAIFKSNKERTKTSKEEEILKKQIDMKNKLGIRNIEEVIESDEFNKSSRMRLLDQLANENSNKKKTINGQILIKKVEMINNYPKTPSVVLRSIKK